MAIKLSQSLKQTQTLMMTPQLQQAIKLLTLTHLEMTNLIATEMVENPMLEELGEDPFSNEETKETDYSLDKLETQNHETTSEEMETPQNLGPKDDFDWNSYVEGFNNLSSTPAMAERPDSEDAPSYENMVSKSEGLVEHLENQLRLESFIEEEWKVVLSIIHNLNDDGYLEVPFDEIIAETGHNREDALELLKMVQNCDPVGCAARNLEECLMIQAKACEERMPLVETLIKDHLKDLYKKDYETIAKVIGVSKETIKEAEHIILSFHPKPGRLVSSEETHYVVPDIYIVEVAGEVVVQLNDEGVPRLKISNLYKSMLNQGNKDTKAKEFVEEKLRSALWLIKSIQNRQKTITKVANAILKYQPEFFKKGPAYLRPMILKDIAAEIGMHESTVSRVTTNKYMHTPIGTLELKYFFSSKVGGKNGGIDMASESLKIRIKKLIQAENPMRPLSDQKIVEILAKEDIQVARRTVAKYREEMSIAPSALRKRMA